MRLSCISSSCSVPPTPKNGLKLIGLDCANCAAQIENAIQKIDGVKYESVSFMTGKLMLECEDNSQDEILKKVKKVVKREEPDVEVKEL